MTGTSSENKEKLNNDTKNLYFSFLNCNLGSRKEGFFVATVTSLCGVIATNNKSVNKKVEMRFGS